MMKSIVSMIAVLATALLLTGPTQAGYADGMNQYATYHVMHGGVDPMGLYQGKDHDFKAVAKSYIALLGNNIGDVKINLGMKFYTFLGREYTQDGMEYLAEKTDEWFDENPQTWDKDEKTGGAYGKYRLRSQTTVEFTCCNGKLLKKRGHADALFAMYSGQVGPEPGPDPPKGFHAKKQVNKISDKSFEVEWEFRGRPARHANMMFDLLVRNRTATHIWHSAKITITCNKDDSYDWEINSFKGSKFPSHRIWIDDRKKIQDEIQQGDFYRLWIADPNDPNRIE